MTGFFLFIFSKRFWFLSSDSCKFSFGAHVSADSQPDPEVNDGLPFGYSINTRGESCRDLDDIRWQEFCEVSANLGWFPAKMELWA